MVTAPRMIDAEIITSAINENILGGYSSGIKSCDTGKDLLKYLKSKFPGVDSLSILETAKNRGFWQQCGFDKFYRIDEKDKKKSIQEIVDGWE
jgi:hypothetical protein